MPSWPDLVVGDDQTLRPDPPLTEESQGLGQILRSAQNAHAVDVPAMPFPSPSVRMPTTE